MSSCRGPWSPKVLLKLGYRAWDDGVWTHLILDNVNVKTRKRYITRKERCISPDLIPRFASNADPKYRRNFDCVDCGVNTHERYEYYMLRKTLWMSIIPEESQTCSSRYGGMLCIGCVEQRLGRTLRFTDFAPCRVNEENDVKRSIRLQRRMMAHRSNPVRRSR